MCYYFPGVLLLLLSYKLLCSFRLSRLWCTVAPPQDRKGRRGKGARSTTPVGRKKKAGKEPAVAKAAKPGRPPGPKRARVSDVKGTLGEHAHAVATQALPRAHTAL